MESPAPGSPFIKPKTGTPHRSCRKLSAPTSMDWVGTVGSRVACMMIFPLFNRNMPFPPVRRLGSLIGSFIHLVSRGGSTKTALELKWITRRELTVKLALSLDYFVPLIYPCPSFNWMRQESRSPQGAALSFPRDEPNPTSQHFFFLNHLFRRS